MPEESNRLRGKQLNDQELWADCKTSKETKENVHK